MRSSVSVGVLALIVGLTTAAKVFDVTVLSVQPLKFEPRAGLANEDWVATGSFSDAVDHPSNFGTLDITTKSANDNAQMFAAGFSEGYLTAERIHQHYQNMMCQVDCSGSVPTELSQFFDKQNAWARSQVSKHPSSGYWQFIGSLLSQFDGLVKGYSASEYGQSNPLDLWAFTMINAMGDLFDIMPAVLPSSRPNFHGMNYKEAQSYLTSVGHCSALIKVTDDLSDLYVGHNAWFVYSSMLRIYKTYNFALQNAANKATITSFSSYPATLSSLDDFYMMKGSDLIMTQTTNNIFNATLWDLVQPESLLAWQRVRTANQLANAGSEWYSIVSEHNSGTYNNQYMVIDTKKFQAGSALQPGTLFVVEQIPGLVAGADVTNQLFRGYWPSYNVPYFPEIYVASGYVSVDEKGGVLPFTQYQQAPRAKIFRRDESAVHDLATMQRIMRSNDFQTDPYSDHSPWGAISARGDLAAVPNGAGGYDSKITSISAFRPHYLASGKQVQMQASIVNGPTAQGQKPFVWSTSTLTDKHVGQPDVFDFEFETVSVPV